MTADEFNAVHPIGTRVRFWPGIRYRQEGIESCTLTPAWTIGEIAVVTVEGYAGGIALTHIEVMKEPHP